MKIVLLSSAASIHTLQWAKELKYKGIDVSVISQHPPAENFPRNIPLYILPFTGFLGYFLNSIPLKKILKKISPDLLNVHYASGYGTTGRLANYKPYVLSVWGSDVYDFPSKSFFHEYLIRRNLSSPTSIASTSLCMAEQTKAVQPSLQTIHITPFGVDIDRFLSQKSNDEHITIGTVKTLADKYGIDLLINAFDILLKRLKQNNNKIYKSLRLRIVGSGPQEAELKTLVKQLHLESVTEFVGFVDHSQVPHELSKFDIYVALSRLDSESFGVAIVEAQAVGIPVVVSAVGGLPEVVKNNITGFVVDRENAFEASLAMEQLVLDERLRLSMGEAGRKHVEREFAWSTCTDKMIQVYQDAINQG